MIEFVLGAAVLGLFTLLVVVLPFLERGGREASRAARDAAIFRDQLAEVDRDLARGLISEEEARGTRAEISRRLIAATQAAQRAEGFGPAPRPVSLKLLAAAALGIPLLGLGIYVATGDFGRPDSPFAERSPAQQRAAVSMLPGQRLSQADAEALAEEQGRVPPPEIDPARDPDAVRLADLTAAVAADPEDDVARVALAEAYMLRGRYAEAAGLFQQAIRLRAPRMEAGLFTSRAEALVLAAGGYVSPAAEKALRSALRIDPQDQVARYYAGLAIAQTGDTDRAVAIWRRLLSEAEPGDPWVPQVEAVLAQATGRVGAPQDRRDPDAVAAVESMSPEEQAAFMADRMAALEERLAERGGTVEDWVMLMRSYRMMNRPEDARRVFEMSQADLQGSEASAVREQALVLGIVSE